MFIEVTDKDLDALTGFIKVFGSCYFKELSGKQCLAHIRLMDEIIVLANKIAKVKDERDNPKPVDTKPVVDNKSPITPERMDAMCLKESIRNLNNKPKKKK